MYKKPNMNTSVSESKQKNDLFRKFKDYFIGATEKEFRQYDYYGTDSYISVNPLVEQKVINTLSHNIDELLPITGPTGIGKTKLLLYCLKTYYGINDIPTNHPIIVDRDNQSDLIYYSDFNITEKYVLDNPTELYLAKIKAMLECVTNKFNINSLNINEYIQNNKLEVKYYSDEKSGYQKELYKLTAALGLESTPIKNIVFIFDDLEALSETQQYDLMENFLKLFENFKNKSNGKYSSKFIFCLRNATYQNIYRRDFYNTHRSSKNCQIYLTPSLSEIFKNRFDVILKSEKTKKAKNEETWKEAKDILISISNRVDSSYKNLLLKINNDNISNALNDFLEIISNRRWTQKNVNPATSFKIEENEYYINDTNILRILCMGERDVYFQNMNMPIRCILPDPGRMPEEDLIAFLVLQTFKFNNSSIENHSKFFSSNDIAKQIIHCSISPQDDKYQYKKETIEVAVQKAFDYYEENRFIRKNVEPEPKIDSEKYYLLPRGEKIFSLFFSQSILFNILRDEFFFDDQKFNISCSNKLSFEDLFLEALTYEQHLIQVESRLFSRISENKTWRDYLMFFGTWSASESFLTGIKKSIEQYYKNKTIPAPKEITDRIDNLTIEVNNLTGVFSSNFEENNLW